MIPGSSPDFTPFNITINKQTRRVVRRVQHSKFSLRYFRKIIRLSIPSVQSGLMF